MSEKRVVYINILKNYYRLREADDNNYCCRRLDSTEVSDLLNEQQSIIDEQKIAIDELITDYKELEKENEQLKKRNKFLEEFDGRAKTVANLKEENGQLKKRNNFLEEFDDQAKIAANLKKENKDCGTCKHLQIDGMFGMWCDLDKDWENVEYCSDWER